MAAISAQLDVWSSLILLRSGLSKAREDGSFHDKGQAKTLFRKLESLKNTLIDNQTTTNLDQYIENAPITTTKSSPERESRHNLWLSHTPKSLKMIEKYDIKWQKSVHLSVGLLQRSKAAAEMLGAPKLNTLELDYEGQLKGAMQDGYGRLLKSIAFKSNPLKYNDIGFYGKLLRSGLVGTSDVGMINISKVKTELVRIGEATIKMKKEKKGKTTKTSSYEGHQGPNAQL